VRFGRLSLAVLGSAGAEPLGCYVAARWVMFRYVGLRGDGSS
jgi:hypothetical protein